MHTETFLKSSVEDLLHLNDNRCFMCSECLKARDQLVAYKYPKTIGSQYQKEYQETLSKKGGWRATEFNLDKEKA